MRQDHRFYSWLVECGSEEQARNIRQELAAFPLTSISFPDTVRAFPGGCETQLTQTHVVGDYFANVSILAESSPSSFQLLFH